MGENQLLELVNLGMLPFEPEEALATNRLVHDVLPAGTLAISDDGYGNFFLLRFSDGSIEWWDHERHLGDEATDKIAPSFLEFLNYLSRLELDEE